MTNALKVQALAAASWKVLDVVPFYTVATIVDLLREIAGKRS